MIERKAEEAETNEKIQAIQQDIQQTGQLIDEIDKKMADMNMRKKLIEPSQNSYYSDENSLIEEDKRNEPAGSVFSKRDDRESSFYNQTSFKDLNNKSQQVNISVYQENNEIIEQIKKKKGGSQDENVKKMDKSCDVCRIMWGLRVLTLRDCQLLFSFMGEWILLKISLDLNVFFCCWRDFFF